MAPLSQPLFPRSFARVRVLMHGRVVGTVAVASGGVLAFEYSREWLRDGFSISPLSLPLEQRVFVAKPHPLDGVFGVFDDSLPDGWGRLLVDRTLARHGVSPSSIGPLERLSIVGSSGMGALEYRPQTTLPVSVGGVDFDEIAEECARVLKTDASDDLDTLFALGGSSGGARPKILTTIEGEEWIVKFASSVDPPSIGRDEYHIMQAARACGICVPETRLFPSKRCDGYFGVKRFDRENGTGGQRKIHMVSAGALLETSHRMPNLDYETLMRLTLRMTQSAEDMEQLYRLMCFNVFIGNRDDHSKNFSYLYDERKSKWSLSPAYDLTCNPGLYGERATTVNGKGREITLQDIIGVGDKAGLSVSCARSVAIDIHDCVQKEGLLDEL